MAITVLVVEDDAALREAIVDTLEIGDFQALAAPDGETAILMLKEHLIDMVISDVNMPGMDGHALLGYIRTQFPALPVVLMTAYGEVEQAVAAMRTGAVDYLLKPFEASTLLESVRQHTHTSANDLEQPVAVAPSSQQLLQLARRVAATDSTVLISGESGTGKEVLARYIHTHSSRAGEPFIAINCAAIPDNMLEAMLFGHEKGAFTGAIASQPGKFEQANGGTLLLDEISEMALGLQAKLLRVVQEQEVERVGGRTLITLDVRILATTNRSLEDEVAQGRFREDLYYRLNVFPLQWLPLRQRTADIVPLAQRLLEKYCRKMRRQPARFSVAAQQALSHYAWPGNVRELDNVIQRALILQSGNSIEVADLYMDKGEGLAAGAVPSEHSATALPEDSGKLGEDLRQHEFQLIIDALKAANGSRKEAASKLDISPRTLRYKLARIREAGWDIDQLVRDKD